MANNNFPPSGEKAAQVNKDEITQFAKDGIERVVAIDPTARIQDPNPEDFWGPGYRNLSPSAKNTLRAIELSYATKSRDEKAGAQLRQQIGKMWQNGQIDEQMTTILIERNYLEIQSHIAAQLRQGIIRPDQIALYVANYERTAALRPEEVSKMLQSFGVQEHMYETQSSVWTGGPDISLSKWREYQANDYDYFGNFKNQAPQQISGKGAQGRLQSFGFGA